jgi:hypothetical protein
MISAPGRWLASVALPTAMKPPSLVGLTCSKAVPLTSAENARA